ncbi:MAG: rod shape-determining protein MreD [Phycisphaerae bacterium]
MRLVKFVIFAYVALILQTAFLPIIFPDQLRPSALVILANLYLLSKPNEWTVLLVWVVGLMGDLTSISPLGSQALAFGLFGMLILTLRPVLFADSPLAHAVTSATGVIIISAIYAIETVLTRHALPLPFSVVEVVGQALTTGTAAALLTKILMPPKKHPARW